MSQEQALQGWSDRVGQAVLEWFTGWWQALFLGAQLLVLALSPSSYRQESGRAVMRQIYHAGGPGLPGFTALMALFNVVVIRIVVATAFAYGLSAFALETIVRVLVLELIPLVAALYVAVNYSVPAAAELYDLRRDGSFERMSARGVSPLGQWVLPRVLGAAFAVPLLALVSCIISLVLAYVAIYGFTSAGLPAYNRAVGHIFDSVVTLIFGLKTMLFAFTVALQPAANSLRRLPRGWSRTRVELRGLMQMLVVLLLIETVSLLGNY